MGGELVHTTRSGNQIIVASRWALKRDEQGQPEAILEIDRDITSRKETESALRRSEENYRSLVGEVKDYAIFALDAEGRVITWNKGAEQIKGYLPDEIIGKHFSVFYPREDVAAGKPERELEVAAAEGRFEDEGGWRVRKDGSRFWANVVITALRDEQGRLRGFAKVTRDITERKRAEDAVRELTGRLLRAQDEERRRIARELHDSTAQTLSGLALSLALIETRPAVTKDARTLKAIRESQKLAKRAATEIRNLSHLLHPPDLDTVGLLAAIRWHAARFSEQTAISVELGLPDDLCRLPSDIEIALFRVVQESLTNVQRHSGSKMAKVRITQSGHEVTVEIEDQGRGMPDSVRNHHWEGVSPLGVGIAGMRERMKQLGGRLEIASGDGQGTTVKVTVPCPPEKA